MNHRRLLIDFGSTFTKVVYVDLVRHEIIARAKHPSTVDTDITEGLHFCLEEISRDTGERTLETRDALACSSAAGGLRIACVGFVPDYSSEAANLAALGAGAKVVRCYSYETNRKEIEELKEIQPDIILLTGGTDGGDKRVIVHNAHMLAGHAWPDTKILFAGNKAASDEIRDIFENSGLEIILTDNVMPEIGRLAVDACHKKIRELFITHIIEAKGIGKAKKYIQNILMPTPSAVLDAAELLADGWGDINGLGELFIIDVGGATTDIHSVADGSPGRGAVTLRGLPEPRVKRSVEGDLGLLYNIDSLIELLREREEFSKMEPVARRFMHRGAYPDTREEIECHTLLSRLAVEKATDRHAGRVETRYGPTGEILVQHGKDFTGVKNVIGTGGPIVFSKNPAGILEGALFREERPHILKPRAPTMYVDAEYILFVGGLLRRIEPAGALRFMKRYVKEV